ncbi:MAG: hypothetical protein ACPG8W_12560 [Candidatus Promineifilaceae bacterium]
MRIGRHAASQSALSLHGWLSTYQVAMAVGQIWNRVASNAALSTD